MPLQHAQRDKLEKARQEQLIQQVTQRVVEAQAAAGPDKPVALEKAALDASEASALESPEPTPGVLRAWASWPLEIHPCGKRVWAPETSTGQPEVDF